MTQWESQVEGHDIFSLLAQLDASLETAEQTEELDRVDRESISRLVRGTGYIRSVLERVDPALVPMKSLDNLAGRVAQLHAEISNFLGDGTVAHLENAQAHLDPALQLTQQIPVVTTAEDVEGLRQSIVEYRRSAGQHVRYLQQEVDELRKQVSALEDTIEAKTQELAEHVQTQKKTATEQVEAQKNEISQQKARLDQAIQNFVEQSTEAREKHSTQVTDLLTTGKEGLSELLSEGEEALNAKASELEKEFRARLDTLVDDADAEVSGLRGKQEKAAEIVGIIARTGMAGGYQQEADDERKQADFWRWIAVGAMAAIVGLAVWMVVTVAQDTADTTALVTKLFASLTLGILAGYAGREAGKHRRREQRNRRLQLELSSIDSYLETLPEKERNAIKGALADRLFGNPDPPTQEGVEGVKPASMMDFVKLLMPTNGQ